MSRLMDFPAQAGRVGVVYWQEEVYRKIQSMKEMYLPELNELYQKIAIRCQQPKRSDPIEKLKHFKAKLERMIKFLQVPKGNISRTYTGKLGKLAWYEGRIIKVHSFIHKHKQPASSQQPGQNGVGPLQQS